MVIFFLWNCFVADCNLVKCFNKKSWRKNKNVDIQNENGISVCMHPEMINLKELKYISKHVLIFAVENIFKIS